MKESLKANKKLGQHFLKDKNIIQAIIKTMPENTSCIVEIGPGLGAITHQLLGLQKKIILIEKDHRFATFWDKQSINCLQQDVMDIDWQQFFELHHLVNEHVWLVSNLPYNISAPLTVNLMSFEYFSSMTLMYQKEVAEKILGIKGMSSLYALSHAFFDVEKVCAVKPGAFLPPPKVDSLVLRYQRKIHPLVPLKEYRLFEQFLRQLFAYPRKQIHSVLKKFMPIPWQQSSSLQEINPTLRAEKLAWDQLLSLYQYYALSAGK